MLTTERAKVYRMFHTNELQAVIENTTRPDSPLSVGSQNKLDGRIRIEESGGFRYILSNIVTGNLGASDWFNVAPSMATRDLNPGRQ